MLATFVDSPATWLMAAFLVIYVGAQVYTLIHYRRLLRLTPWMIAGLAMFVVSFLLNQSYNIFEDTQSNAQVRTWQTALAITAVLYVVILWWLSWMTDLIRQNGALVIVLMAGVTLAAYNTTEGFAIQQKAYELLQVCLIFFAAVLCYLQTRKLQDRVPWVVLVAAEGYTIPQYYMCQFVNNPEIRVEGSACVHYYGYFAEWTFSVVCAAVLIWFLTRWYQARGIRS